jgi:glutathione S-transferase
MRLHYHPMSSNARRAVTTAIHLNADLELVFVDLAKGEHKTPEFLRLNPGGKVPVLEDGDFALTESHAIMQYLADKTPGQTLYPTDLRARADVNRWLFWNAAHFQSAVAILNWENVVKRFIGLGDPDPAAVQRGEGLVTELSALLDAHLAGKRWISNDTVTLADLAVATPLDAIDRAKLPVRDFKNVMGWLERVQGLDAWNKSGM